MHGQDPPACCRTAAWHCPATTLAQLHGHCRQTPRCRLAPDLLLPRRLTSCCCCSEAGAPSSMAPPPPSSRTSTPSGKHSWMGAIPDGRPSASMLQHTAGLGAHVAARACVAPRQPHSPCQRKRCNPTLLRLQWCASHQSGGEPRKLDARDHFARVREDDRSQLCRRVSRQRSGTRSTGGAGAVEVCRSDKSAAVQCTALVSCFSPA